MKRKANDDAKPKQSAAVGFNKLFAKRPKKTKPVSETINLCDDDDEKENSIAPKVESKTEQKIHQKVKEKSKEEASDEFYVPDIVPESPKTDSDKSKTTKETESKETETKETESKVEIDVDDLDDSKEQEEQTSMVKVRS